GRLMRLPRADWGKAVAHAGHGVTMAGVAGLTAGTVDDIRVAQIGQPWEVGSYELTLNDVQVVRGPNYVSTFGFLTLSHDGLQFSELRP
ncbi:cytochrome c-type biogenesis CcmF C-terminal domain-containing protein, partial [Marimonas sp. MJW-29]